jgi:hypothetical protein
LQRDFENPITGIAGCCARAASGQTAAAAPSSVMNARLFTRSPRRRERVASAASETERFDGGQIDDELDFGRLLDRDVGGLRPAPNLIDMIVDAAERQVWSVGHQSPGHDVIADIEDGRKTVAQSKRDDAGSVGGFD